MYPLKIQELIREVGYEGAHKKLTSPPYNIEIKHGEVNGIPVNLYKYSQISSDMSLKECQEARGVILEETHAGQIPSPRIVNIGFDKFFNYNEPNAHPIDLTKSFIQEKVDGSIIKVTLYRGEVLISTNGAINGMETDLPFPSSSFKTFGDLVMHLITQKRVNLEDILDERYSYIFELVGPHNHVVVPYPEDDLVFLGARDKQTGKERPSAVSGSSPESSYGFRTPVVHHFEGSNSEEIRESIIETCEGLDWTEEGFVVVQPHEDGTFTRVKMKGKEYLAAHRLRGETSPTVKSSIEMIRTNKLDDFLGYFPQLSELPLRVQSIIRNKIGELRVISQEIKNRDLYTMPRKNFAELVKTTFPNEPETHPFCFHVYSMLNGQKELPQAILEDKNDMLDDDYVIAEDYVWRQTNARLRKMVEYYLEEK